MILSPVSFLNLMHHILRLTTFALLAIAVRAAVGQYSPNPGERGDPYAPRGPAATVQMRYPLPGAVAPGAPAQSPPAYQAPPQTVYPRQPQQTVAALPTQPPTEPEQAPPALVSGELFEPTKIMAVVGNQYIFYGDALPLVTMVLEPYAAKATNKFELAELEKARPVVTRQVVQQLVNTKIMYQEFERTIEKNTKGDQKKLAEIKADMQKRMLESFEKELTEYREKIATAKPDKIQEMIRRDTVMPRVALLMRDNQAESLAELDTILRRYGSSLDKQVRAYGEDRLGRQIVGKGINKKHEVTHQEMLNYYRDHEGDFALSAKAKFEILTVKFVSFPDKGAAYNVIAQMGNEVYFGAPFATIARKHSQEPGAKNGGAYDWTTQGSLASEVIDRALFTLETGKLSQIVEDAVGYHIVRVTERQDAGTISFVEAQPKIKEAIQQQKREVDYKTFLAKLQSGTKVWTIYDDEDAALAQKAAAAGAPQQR